MLHENTKLLLEGIATVPDAKLVMEVSYPHKGLTVTEFYRKINGCEEGNLIVIEGIPGHHYVGVANVLTTSIRAIFSEMFMQKRRAYYRFDKVREYCELNPEHEVVVRIYKVAEPKAVAKNLIHFLWGQKCSLNAAPLVFRPFKQ